MPHECSILQTSGRKVVASLRGTTQLYPCGQSGAGDLSQRRPPIWARSHPYFFEGVDEVLRLAARNAFVFTETIVLDQGIEP